MSFTSVDLPAPVSPTRATVSPGRTSRSTPRRASGGRRTEASGDSSDGASLGPRRGGAGRPSRHRPNGHRRWDRQNRTDSNSISPLQAARLDRLRRPPGSWSRATIRSAMRPTDTLVCCQESNTCESCWIGEKNMSM